MTAENRPQMSRETIAGSTLPLRKEFRFTDFDPYFQDKRMHFTFAEGTKPPSHFETVRPMHELLRLKQEKGLHLTVAVPTLNEGANIGRTLGNIVPLGAEGVGLVDRLVVVDSNSTDNTRDVADTMGIEVVNAADAFNALGLEQTHGKGANLALVSADHREDHEVVVFCDADFGVEPSQIQGVLSPLIANDHTQLSLAWMDRITHEGDMSKPGAQGGRATRFTFNPIMKLLYPELDGLQQPICGLYAARGSALHEVPFPIDYRVETALLTHVADQYRDQLRIDPEAPSPFAQTFCGTKDQAGQKSEKIEVMSHQIAMQAITSAWLAGRTPVPYESITQYTTHRAKDGTAVISSTEVPMRWIDMPSPYEIRRGLQSTTGPQDIFTTRT